jgi:predicted transcriptional regulator
MNSKALKIAQEALDIAWDGRLPVNPALLASKLLVDVKDAAGDVVKSTIVVRGVAGTELLGASSQVRLEQTPDGLRYLCEYNRDEISYRSRFTVAHEIGHILLGHVHAGEAMLCHHEYGDTSPQMTQANAFAAALLMPERFLRQVFDGVKSLQQMAEVFGVSNQAASYRIKALRLL